MSGQTCFKQVCATEWTGSRSAFANATASLALALGANAGKAITDVPSVANIAKARRDLVISDADYGQTDPAAHGIVLSIVAVPSSQLIFASGS